ncbi:MAG: hypothetical protein ACLQBL_36935 [Polyangiaceae bacterium]
MTTALLFLASLMSLGALAFKDRERIRAQMALDAERHAHELTRSERDGLRAALDRMASEREQLETELAEVRAMREGAYR